MKKIYTTIIAVFAIIQFSYAQWTNQSGTNNYYLNPGNAGIGTTAPTHALTFGSSSSGIVAYNTADQTTDYEYVRQYWSGDAFNILAGTGGTGTRRNIVVKSGGASFTVGQTSTGFFTFGNPTYASSAFPLIGVGGTMTGSTDVNMSLGITPTVNSTGVSGYKILFISPYQQAVGSGVKYLIDAGTNTAANGTGTHTSRFTVDNSGNIVTPSTATNGYSLYNTSDQTTNYERVRQYWIGNIFRISSESAGTGTNRSVDINSSSSVTISAGTVRATFSGNTITGGVNLGAGSAGSGSAIGSNPNFLASSGLQYNFSFLPKISQSGTAGYSVLWISPFESSTGTGNKYLIDAGTNNAANGVGAHTPKFTITNTGTGYFSGNVGMGTTAPNTKLEVRGAVLSGGAEANLGIIPGPGSIGFLQNSGRMIVGWNRSASEGETDFIGNQGLGTSGGFSFYNYDNAGVETRLVRIKGDGNVGIGTAYPDAKLAVNGNIHSKEVLVDLNITGPDYVFKPDYKLPTLNEIKEYVEKNHHLPEIPSADEMAKNGIILGDMNMKLLKKVEELTLYLIEQQKQTELLKQEQGARIAALEKALAKLNGTK